MGRVCGALAAAKLAALACAAGERETDPAAMAATAPAVTILLARIRCFPPCVDPPVYAGGEGSGRLDAIPAKPRVNNV